MSEYNKCIIMGKEVEIFFSDNTNEIVKESYDFVLSQLEM